MAMMSQRAQDGTGDSGTPGLRDSRIPGLQDSGTPGRWMNSAALVIGPMLLAVVFLASGAGKALQPEPTAKTIGVLLNTPAPSVLMVAALVFVEFLLAAWLVSGWAPRAALGGTILALLGFSAALGALLIVNRRAHAAADFRPCREMQSWIMESVWRATPC